MHGECTLNGAINAESRLSPRDDYAMSKYEAEKGLRQICENSEMDYIIIRPPLIFGLPLRGNLNSLGNLLRYKLPVPISGLSNNKRALVSIENLVDFIETCIVSSTGRNQTYLVRDSRHYSTFEIFHIISTHLRKKLRSFYLPVFLLQLLLKLLGKQKVIEKLFCSYEVDIDKNYKILNWKPKKDVSSRK